jgi:hypothetical protein
MIERGYLALALGFDWSLFARRIAASFESIIRSRNRYPERQSGEPHFVARG